MPNKRPRHGRPHEGELNELAGIGTDIGAHIEHDAFRIDRGPDRSDGRTVNPLDRPQAKLGHGHERASIAGGDDGIGMVVADGLDGEPHARLPTPPAERLARLRVHGDGDIGMNDFAFACEGGIGRKLRGDL